MSDKPDRRAFLGFLGVGAAAGAAKAAGVSVDDDKTAEVNRQLAKLRLGMFQPINNSGLKSIGLDWRAEQKRTAKEALEAQEALQDEKIEQFLANQTWGESHRDPEDIFRDLLMGDIAEQCAALELQDSLASSWEVISNYKVRGEYAMMAELLNGKIAKVDMTRIVSPKFIIDPFDLAARQKAVSSAEAMEVPFATFPKNMYVRHCQDKLPQQHLADILIKSHSDMLTQLDHQMADTVRLAKSARVRAAQVRYVTYPAIEIKRSSFMLEIFSYMHVVFVAHKNSPQ
jgi:hypothetical protein